MTEDHITHETLMRFVDGELSPAERASVESDVERSTELRREVAIYRALHDDLSTLTFDQRIARESIWDRVNRRLTRPIGWLLFCAGVAAWSAHFVWVFLTSATASFETFATSAIVIGVLLVFASVIHDRYREALTDPYRHVEH